MLHCECYIPLLPHIYFMSFSNPFSLLLIPYDMISVQSILRCDDPDLVAKHNFMIYPFLILCIKE